MRALDRLGELHLVADEDDGLGGGRHRDEVAERDLAGLVDEEQVERAAADRPGEEPGGAADDRQREIDVAVIRDALDVTAPLVAVAALPSFFWPSRRTVRRPPPGAASTASSTLSITLWLFEVTPTVLPACDERQDQVRGRVGLAGAGRPLDNQPGAIERMDGALRRFKQPRRVVPVSLGHDRRAGSPAYQPRWIAAQKGVDVREGVAVSRHVARSRPDGVSQYDGVRSARPG